MVLVPSGAPPTKLTIRVGAILVCLAFSQCSGGNTPTTPTGPTTPTVPGPPTQPSPNPTPTAGPRVFAGAGDIANCTTGGRNHERTARLLDTIQGDLFTLGDNAYFSGSTREYRECYDVTWGGRHKGRTHPSPGNHEYVSPGAVPYFEYFQELAGPFGRGYYSFPLGDWLILSLNSEDVSAEANSPQGIWLRGELERNTARCTLAYWHKPLFSSGPNGDHPHMQPFWRMLYAAGADLILSGHDHMYERFLPQDPDGRLDMRFGIRQFIVGTGGVDNYDFRASKPNSEVRLKTHGVLKLTLNADSYQWELVTVSGVGDSGTESCH